MFGSVFPLESEFRGLISGCGSAVVWFFPRELVPAAEVHYYRNYYTGVPNLEIMIKLVPQIKNRITYPPFQASRYPQHGDVALHGIRADQEVVRDPARHLLHLLPSIRTGSPSIACTDAAAES